MSAKSDRKCGETIVKHFKGYAVTDYVWSRNAKDREWHEAALKKMQGGHAPQFGMVLNNQLTQGNIERGGARLYNAAENAKFGVCDNFAWGVCYGIIEDAKAGRWKNSTAELIQGGGHSYIICNRNQVDDTLRASSQVNNDTFILDAWYWCLHRCKGNAVISNKADVIQHLSAFHPTKVPSNGSARAGGVKCNLNLQRGQNGAPVKRCCYLTTASCEVMGLADNCEELETLRWYRDKVMAQSEQGRRDIAEYYKQAPQILQQLAPEEHATLYRGCFERFIVPSVGAIKRGEYELAYNTYREMVKFLFVASLSNVN